MKKIAILGSGNGYIFESIVNYFSNNSDLDVDIFCISDNLHDEILEKAKNMGIKNKYVPYEENFEFFSSHDFDLIVLDNYSKDLQSNLFEIARFINIHPSLLPAFKGKDAIARAFSSGVKVSGVTVHTLTNKIDGGKILAQFPVLIGNSTHFDEFQAEIHALEQNLAPIVIEKVLEDKVFDFSDLISNHSCGGNCGGCSNCS